MQTMEIGTECLNRQMSGYDLLCEVIRERNRAYDQIIRLRKVIDGIRETLNQQQQVRLDELERQAR